MVDIQKSIKIKDGRPLISSRTVAKAFEKEKFIVMRDIREVIKKVSPEFGEINFVLSAYKAGNPPRKYDEYLMTKDGFVILVMGYTGEKAMQFKEAYINKFNEMEAFIKERNQARMSYPAMTAAIKADRDEAKHYHFSNEADLINRIALGMTAKQIKIHRNIQDDRTRDHLTKEEIDHILKLQQYNTIMLEQHLDFQYRKAALKNYFNFLNKNNQKVLCERS